MLRFWMPCALGLVPSLLGCGGAPTVVELPVYPVSGRVTVDGKAAEGVSLTFVPTGTTKGQGGYAISQADGSFDVTSNDGRRGIPEGDYKVVLSRWTMPDGSPIPPNVTAADANAVNKLPQAYSDPSQSPAYVKIQAGPNTDLSVDVSSKFVPSL